MVRARWDDQRGDLDFCAVKKDTKATGNCQREKICCATILGFSLWTWVTYRFIKGSEKMVFILLCSIMKEDAAVFV